MRVFRFKGCNQVLVPVVLGYDGKEVQVSLLLDTGASITTLNRDSIKKLQAVPVHKGKMIVPGGKTIDANADISGALVGKTLNAETIEAFKKTSKTR